MIRTTADQIIFRLLAAGELEPAPADRQMADSLIRAARDRLAKLPGLRPIHAGAAHHALYLAVSNAMSATLEVQGLHPGEFGDKRGPADVDAAKSVYEVVKAQLGAEHPQEVEMLGRLCREQEAVEYRNAPAPEVTDDDIRDAAAVVDLAERIVNETEAGR